MLAIVGKGDGDDLAAIQKPEVKAAWDKQGAVAMPMTPAEFDAYLRKDIDKWGKVVRDANLKPQ